MVWNIHPFHRGKKKRILEATHWVGIYDDEKEDHSPCENLRQVKVIH